MRAGGWRRDTAYLPPPARPTSCKKREKQVLANIAQGRATQLPDTDSSIQITLGQSDASAIHRHISIGAHGNTNLTLRQGQSIVDTIAGNRDPLALMLQSFDLLRFLIWQHASNHLIQNEFLRYDLSGGFAVAGRHDDIQPLGVERLNGTGRGLLMGPPMPCMNLMDTRAAPVPAHYSFIFRTVI